MNKRESRIYLTKRFFLSLLLIVSVFVLSYSFSWMYFAARLALLVMLVLTLTDIVWLFFPGGKLDIQRTLPARFSLGDDNPVLVTIRSTFPAKLNFGIIEELPPQFQKRDFWVSGQLSAGESYQLDYLLKPLTRGEYKFGNTNVYISGMLGLVQRRIKGSRPESVAVYPSFISMRKFELMAISNRLEDVGVKRIRKVGQHSEFDQIREYVPGDDSRTINWKATARRAALMVNQYQDERSQQVISLIDMGRVMEIPFNGMTLLDYAINASLIISNTAMYKHDRAGLLTFSNQIHSFIHPDRKGGHLQRILEVLYNQQTDFCEPSYEKLYATVSAKIKQRSLLILYTNFEGIPSLKRQLPYLKRLAGRHLLLVVFFENTEVLQMADSRSHNLEEVYIHSMARKFVHDKKRMVRELKRAGIMALLTAPESLSVNLINKYLEIKAREMI
ncbi:DUF58 domain-containing protein [Maribellus sp. CM-23]|uniref:DUF58 domain-containing protein n=1 Tax=Maribellus sp. CM-23 TaxID=2781026 RepID=UPI001F4671B2|nr:DUF58 domain-containing protein [Maribellus sp. CM-23]MCE4563003.1 DUF58 domain-containing protein [Maribellus sp. CM-23]